MQQHLPNHKLHKDAGRTFLLLFKLVTDCAKIKKVEPDEKSSQSLRISKRTKIIAAFTFISTIIT